MSPAEVEVDRVLNAMSATLNDQRPDNPSAAQLQEIADGACGGERRLHVRSVAGSRFELHDPQDGELLAIVERTGADDWAVSRA